ncbi:Protein NUCLEAR FUSION DEFECTIVE 4 [Ananas comosus]|uniref:Protein NUCLEAR FUSION DEFECTIVE 4 n=1 Tax=Ananas comosus TaxID=4615 RepID=A0A199V0N1_ANACO|nr:Protein NUCLEAR FUSION DEFECTIVE 4 [Ananas comosus]
MTMPLPPPPPSSSSSSLQWLSLVGTLWLQSINGANSDFPVYSSQLKDLKHFSQVQLNFLAFASDAGKLFGWFSGIAANHLPLWLVAVIGAVLGLIGYGLQFLFLENSNLSYWHLFILTSLAGNGICWINTVCYLICIKNFSFDSRVAVGISTSYVGLSAKVYTVVAEAVFSPRAKSKAKSYLLLNAVTPVLVTTLVAPFLRVVDAKHKEGKRDPAFVAMFAITLATGVCAVAGSIGSASPTGFSSREHMLSLGVLLASPLVVPVAFKLKESISDIWGEKRERRVHGLSVDEIELGGRERDMEEEGKKEQEEEEEEEEQQQQVVVAEEEMMRGGIVEGGIEEVGGVKMLKRVEFWLYFLSYMFSGTLGLVFLNNLGQIAESRGLGETSTLVSLSSSFGFFGRLIPALLDYSSSKAKYKVSRSLSMAILMAPMAGSFFLLLNSTTIFLYLSTAIIGACTGSVTSIAVSATSELFGKKHFGVNHNIVVTNIPVGSFCFGYLAAFLYQKGAVGGSHKCFGSGCYNTTFIIWGSTCSIGTVLCTILYVRSRRLTLPKII